MGLRRRPRPCQHEDMDTSTTPHISPDLEPETKPPPMPRYVEDHEEIAYQYAHALVSFSTIDLDISEALQLTRDIVAESTNNIRDLEREEVASRIDVALQRLIDRVRTEPANRAACRGIPMQCDRERTPWGLRQPNPRGHSYTNRTTQPTEKERENEHHHLPH